MNVHGFPRIVPNTPEETKFLLTTPSLVIAIWNGVPATKTGRRLAYLTKVMNPKGTANMWSTWRADAEPFYTKISARKALAAIVLDNVRAQAQIYPNLEVHVQTGGIPGKEEL